MATNAPESRKTHVTRIFGTNKDGDRLDDIWADVERMDVIKNAMQIPPDHQWVGAQRKLRWCDDPTSDDYSAEGTPSRLTVVMKVCDPEGNDDVNDPDEWIPIRVIKGMRSKGGCGEGMGEGSMDRFLNQVTNEELQSARQVKVRRIVHHDTNIDDAAQAAADADPELKEYVVDSKNYTRDEESKDTSQYVEHEIPLFIKHKGNTLIVEAMGRQTKLLNQYLIDESEDATLEITGEGGINPPYRLDPFQNIINVSFGLAAEFFDGAQ